MKSSNLEFYKNVATKDDIRKAAQDHSTEFSKYKTDLWMKEDLYKAIKDYHTRAVSEKTWDKLDSESKRYVNKVLDDFETGGMKLNTEQRQHLVEL